LAKGVIEEHLARIREIGAKIDQQWTSNSMSVADAIREQRK
jgi:hypothetical protein